MTTKNRIGGSDAVMQFILYAKLPYTEGENLKADLQVSAKAGDKWRINKVRLPIEFQYNAGSLDIAINSIEKPFYRAYRHISGTRFIFDIIKGRLFIEGNLNKGRGDPFVICLSC